jgi:hypothetical protein
MPDDIPLVFQVIDAKAERRGDGRVVQTIHLHGDAKFVFSMNEEQAVVLIGQLAVSLQPADQSTAKVAKSAKEDQG